MKATRFFYAYDRRDLDRIYKFAHINVRRYWVRWVVGTEHGMSLTRQAVQRMGKDPAAAVELETFHDPDYNFHMQWREKATKKIWNPPH